MWAKGVGERWWRERRRSVTKQANDFDKGYQTHHCGTIHKRVLWLSRLLFCHSLLAMAFAHTHDITHHRAPTPIRSSFPENLLRIIATKLLSSNSVFVSQISRAHAFPRNHPDSVRLIESKLKHRFDEIFMSTILSLASTWKFQIEITIFSAGVPVAIATLDYQEKAYVLLCSTILLKVITHWNIRKEVELIVLSLIVEFPCEMQILWS